MPPLTFADLERVLAKQELLPIGVTTKPLGPGEFSYIRPGRPNPVRVTTRPDYFDDHSDSMELWSMGAPCFPADGLNGDLTPLDTRSFREIIA